MKKIILINFILLALILKIEAQIPFYSTFKVTNVEKPTPNLYPLINQPNSQSNYNNYEPKSARERYEEEDNYHVSENEIFFKNNSNQIKIITVYFRDGYEWKKLDSYRVFENEEFSIRKSSSEFYSSYGYIVEGSVSKDVQSCFQKNTIY